MSIKLIDAVWSLKLDNEGELLVLLALADNANDEGTHCFPSQRRIAWKTDLTVKSVSDIIGRLEKKGLVETLNKGNQHRPTNYALHLEKGIQKEAFIPSSWAGDKVESTPTEVQVKSVKAEVHVGGSEVHAKESELHLHDGELHVDTAKTNLNCGQQTTFTTQPSVYPSRETHDPVKPLTDAAAPAALGASAKAEEKATLKKDVENEQGFPRPLPYWTKGPKGRTVVVFIVPKLRKFGGPHPRASFQIGDQLTKVWSKDGVSQLEAAEGNVYAGWGRFRTYNGKREFTMEGHWLKGIPGIPSDVPARPDSSPTSASPSTAASAPIDENNPYVRDYIEHWNKTGLALNRKDLESVAAGTSNWNYYAREAAKILLAKMPDHTEPPAPEPDGWECPF